MFKDVESIMNPKSIAVIGASNRPGSVGNAVFSNILNAGFSGVLYPVNPKAASIMSVKAYPSLSAIPDPVDLIIIVVPGQFVPSIIEEAGEKGVKSAIVISAGFKEVGGEGRALEEQLKAAVKKAGISLIGPNCLGVVNNNADVRMNASFAPKMPKPGNIAFISQSGALCTAVLDYAEGRNIGFSKFVSFGNKADVTEVDLLHYLKDDPDTDVILMYLEDIGDGRAFLETAREIAWEKKKPILTLKSGRSAAGARAAASHTGSLAGSDNAYDAIFRQSGIIRVETMGELFDYAVAFSKQPALKGNNIGIVTNAGGPGIMATDAAIRHGLEVATLSDETKEKMAQGLPAAASLNNPVDVIGDATHERYEVALKGVLEDDQVDGAIVLLTPQAMTDIYDTAKVIPKVAKQFDKPVVASFMGTVDVAPGIEHLENNGVPAYPFPEAAARALATMADHAGVLKLEKRQEIKINADTATAAAVIADKLKDKEECYLGQAEANAILEAYGLPVLKNQLVTDASEIAAAVEKVGFPLVMKIASPDIVHKFDAGGVKLNINSLEEAQAAYAEIIANAKKFKADARITGIYMEAMAKKGVEVILGAVRDPQFGPLCMFGLGGTFVEVMKDVSFRLAPMWEVSAEVMIRSIKAYKMLTGFRGTPPADVDAIKDCLLRVSQMLCDNPEIAELDINPLIACAEGEGCCVADSRILLRKVEK